MRIILFSGKGGVGKTTLAAATGVRAASRGHRTLVMSTDAAHSLGDSLALRIGPEPPRVAPNLDAMQIELAKLPSIASCAEVVGEVTTAAAAATGLAAGTPVIAGMTDGTAASIEVGLVRPGDAAEMTGQSTVLLICSDTPYRGRLLFPLGHPIAGMHLVVGPMVATGGALRWFRDQLGESEVSEARQRAIDPFELLSQKAAQSRPGANRVLFLPYMYGERSPIWDSAARGVFFGLSLATTKGDLVRAIMEGAAYGLRHNVETAAADGFPVAGLACVGGGARSVLWNQIKADVLNRPVSLPGAASGAAMGDAIVAAAGAGLYASIEDAVAAMVTAGPVYVPDPANVPICLLYTSDAADERSSVDLGGRRIIKKKNYTRNIIHSTYYTTNVKTVL